MDDTLFLALRVLLSLAAVLGLLWFLHRRLNRGGRARVAKPISVVARQGIGQKASIVIVEAEGRRYVLGVTEHSVEVLDAAERGPGEPAADSAPHAFEERLTRAVSGEPGLMLRPRRRSTALEGSILAPQTWRQAATALRQPK